MEHEFFEVGDMSEKTGDLIIRKKFHPRDTLPASVFSRNATYWSTPKSTYPIPVSWDALFRASKVKKKLMKRGFWHSFAVGRLWDYSKTFFLKIFVFSDLKREKGTSRRQARVITYFQLFSKFRDFQEILQYFLKGFCFASTFFLFWEKCWFCHDLSVILCENWSFVQKIIKIQHFAVNYGRIVVIDFRNAKTLPLRNCFARF